MNWQKKLVALRGLREIDWPLPVEGCLDMVFDVDRLSLCEQ
jgi:hypothetical protein